MAGTLKLEDEISAALFRHDTTKMEQWLQASPAGV